MTIKRKTNKKLLASLETLADFANTSVEVGWVVPNQKHDKTDLNMAQLAYVLINGATITNSKTGTTINIPPRPVFKTTVAQHSKEWVKEAGALSKEVLGGKTNNNSAATVLGALIADDMKGTINNSTNWAPNRPSTVRRKGKNTPLIDTGELRDAVDYRVHTQKTGRIKK